MDWYDDEPPPPPVGRADAGAAPDDTVGEDVPGFYIPDPESRSGLRIWWVKRPKKQNGPPRRQVGFR